MPIALNQLRGMIVYEFRMHWRRRRLLIMMLAFTLVTALVGLLIFEDNLTRPNPLDESLCTMYAISTTWLPLAFGLPLTLPVMVADTIPLDRQHGVRDLLDSLPVLSVVYLIGKLVGIWVMVAVSLGCELIICGLAWWLYMGAFDVIRFAEMAVLGAGTIGILNSSLGVLLAVGQPSRRRAIVMVVSFLALIVFGLPLLMKALNLYGSFIDQMLDPIHLPLVNYFLDGLDGVRSGTILWSSNPVTLTPSEQLRDAIVAGLMEIVVIWTLAWGWLRWRKGRL